MPRPRISWLPVRHMHEIITDKTMKTEDVVRRAKSYGLDAVDMYWRFFDGGEWDRVEEIEGVLREEGVSVSMVACEPDLVNPHPESRRLQMSEMEMSIDIAHRVGAPVVSVTPGKVNTEVNEDYAAALVEESLLELSQFAEPFGIKVALENHYKNRLEPESEDYAAHSETFLKLYDKAKSVPVGIDFDTAAPIMAGEDPLELLDAVKDDVVSVHIADAKRKQHSLKPLGQGDVPIDEILKRLAEQRFSGYISVEDSGSSSEKDLKSSIDLLRNKIRDYWPKGD